MSRTQFHSIIYLYLDMHGLIFETSVWLLAESTRLLIFPGFPSASGFPPPNFREALFLHIPPPPTPRSAARGAGCWGRDMWVTRVRCPPTQGRHHRLVLHPFPPRLGIHPGRVWWWSYTHTHTNEHIHTHTPSLLLRFYTHTHTCTHPTAHNQTHTHKHTQTNIYEDPKTLKHTHTHAHTHTLTSMPTRTHIPYVVFKYNY